MPVGEGVMNSPGLALISAITPANGARSRVFSICCSITLRRALVAALVACAAAQDARFVSARV